MGLYRMYNLKIFGNFSLPYVQNLNYLELSLILNYLEVFFELFGSFPWTNKYKIGFQSFLLN